MTTTKLVYSIEETAERIGSIVTVDWLKAHLSSIPHRKSGNGTGRAGRVGFTEDDIAQIVAGLYRAPVSSAVEHAAPVTRRRAS